MIDAFAIVVGAGFGGLGMAVQLRNAGIEDVIVLERASEVGGTWRDNVYPGCACDVPSMLYSFSFDRRAEWQRVYSQQPELLQYLKESSERTGVRAKIRFNSQVVEARFDDVSETWCVLLKDGTTLVSRMLVSAMGPLNKANVPSFPGAERFAGVAFHSSAWDYGVDLRDKNVVVVGTGASAIQFVPQIAPVVRRLTIFQRSAPWIISRGDKRISGAKIAARRRVPFYAWLVRKAIYWSLEVRAIAFVVNPALLRQQEKLILASLARSIPDETLRKKLTPAYRAGCKRILISDDYYPALQRANVGLVTTPLERIEEHAVVANDGKRYPADVIVYGTGFNATEGFAPVKVFGREGIELGDVWRGGMSAYLGTAIAGFPNFFLVIGPNTGLGHNSMILMMEAQYRYIVGAARFLLKPGVRSVDVRSEAEVRFNADLQKRLARTIWASGCSSWYIDARGKNTSIWPGFTFAFRRLTRRFDPRPYRVTTE